MSQDKWEIVEEKTVTVNYPTENSFPSIIDFEDGSHGVVSVEPIWEKGFGMATVQGKYIVRYLRLKN